MNNKLESRSKQPVSFKYNKNMIMADIYNIYDMIDEDFKPKVNISDKDKVKWIRKYIIFLQSIEQHACNLINSVEKLKNIDDNKQN